MGRQVRKVPKDWQHPKNERGAYIPLMEGSYAQAAARWDEEAAKWAEGFRRNYVTDDWVPKDSDETCAFEEWNGARPVESDYMPDWPEAERTHLMMYEDTSEGTPISPACETPEQLARWLADNGASSFGRDTATYEQWLPTCRGAWAPSMVYSPDKGLRSGVEFSAEPDVRA